MYRIFKESLRSMVEIICRLEFIFLSCRQGLWVEWQIIRMGFIRFFLYCFGQVKLKCLYFWFILVKGLEFFSICRKRSQIGFILRVFFVQEEFLRLLNVTCVFLGVCFCVILQIFILENFGFVLSRRSCFVVVGLIILKAGI